MALDAERERCFDFPLPIQEIATSLRTPTNQLVRNCELEQMESPLPRRQNPIESTKPEKPM